MAYQLIYTSSPKGLAMGRSGFCTVARSADMPVSLASAVEPLGVFERPVSDGEPVSFTLSNITFAQTKYYVLTRAQDCGIDYTNRNNYIAHHLVVSEHEIGNLAANPAEIMLGWSGWRKSWQEEPKLLEDAISLKDIPQIENLLPAKTWEKIFSDAGKAALLTCGQRARIHAPAGSENVLLRLYAESLALEFDTQKRWNASFTTCVSGGASARADWAAYCTDDSGAEIDLSSGTAPDAPSGRAAQYARSGQMTNREKFNLTVKGPQLGKKKFDVVESIPQQKGKLEVSPILIAAAAAAIIAAAAGLWIFFVAGKAPVEDKGLDEGSLKTMPAIQKTESLDALREKISEKIKNDEFADAVEIWKESLSAQVDQSFGRLVNRLICKRFDDLVSDAELLIVRGNFDGAAVKLDTAKKAIDAANPPDAGLRLDKISELRSKIEAKKRK